jgi:hypothetical protein
MKLLLTIALISSAAHVARAQSAEAEALFNDGNKLMAEGRLAQACESFEASNGIEQRAGTLIRLGECREQNHQLASAWSAYKDALTRAKDPKKRDVAAEAVTRLEPELSYLTVSVPDESRVDALVLTRNGKPFEQMLWNRALPVDGGDYVIVGRAPGHEAWQTTAHVVPENGRITVDVPKFKELLKLVPSSEPPSVAIATEPPPLFTTRRELAIGAAGLSVAGVVTGIVLGVSASNRNSAAGNLCPDIGTPCANAVRANQLIDQGQSRALLANVSFGVAAAAAIGASILWFTGGRDDARVSIIPTVGSSNGVVVMSRF